MMRGRRRFLALSGLALLASAPLAAQSGRKGRSRSRARAKAPPDPPLEEGVAARLDLAKVAGGALPAGAVAVAGTWSTDAATKTLRAMPHPLLDAWLEFGPEIREKGALVAASGRAPGRGRLKSRLGVGLYGKNGFQLRTAPARREAELVRRGAVLLRRPLETDADALHHLELSVVGERRHWIVSGRVWTEGGERPEAPLFEHKVFAAELQFPLAGRSVLFATPFSGEPVAFASALVRHGEARSESAPPAEPEA